MAESSINYSNQLTDEEKLAIETCPGFDVAQQRAEADC